VLNNRAKYGKVIVLVGARTPADILYSRQLQAWRGRFDMYVDVTVDRAAGDWAGNVGVVTKLIPRASFDPINTVALVCGPEIMMRFTVAALNEAGVDNDRIHVSMERNMRCAIGFCGHCQYGPHFVCRDGPVFPFARIAPIFSVREI
jgi:NAD(P)H-flavin reductase